MEYVIEMILDLLLEGSMELSTNKKLSKWIRYPLIIFLILFFGIVIFGLFVIGIFIYKENIYGGIFIIAISLLLLGCAIYKFKKLYFERREER